MSVPATAALTVTAIDHAGLMFSDGKVKILVDALIEPSKQWPFDTPSAALLQKMEREDAPFDGISLLLISHAHIDHFSAASTVRFLANHPKALVVTTEEVEAGLKPISGYDEVASRVVAPRLSWKQSLTRTFNGVRIELDRLKHGDDKEWPSQLDVFAFTLGGKKVLFAPATGGFFPEEYRVLGYAGRGFDLAFVNYSMAVRLSNDGAPAQVNRDGLEMIKKNIRAKTTVLMHIEHEHRAEIGEIMPDIERALPGVTVSAGELERRIY